MTTLVRFLALLSVFLGSDGGARAGGAVADDPFRAAALTPADVRLYIHVDRAAAIRAELSDRPLAKWATDLIGQGQTPLAWERLGEAARIDSEELFDKFLGNAFTVVVRGRDELTDWAVLTEVETADTRELLARLDTAQGAV